MDTNALLTEINTIKRIECATINSLIQDRAKRMEEQYSSNQFYETISPIRIEHILDSDITEERKPAFSDYLYEYAEYTYTFDITRNQKARALAKKCSIAGLAIASTLGTAIGYAADVPLVGFLGGTSLEVMAHPAGKVGFRWISRGIDRELVPQYQEGIMHLREKNLQLNFPQYDLRFL